MRTRSIILTLTIAIGSIGAAGCSSSSSSGSDATSAGADAAAGTNAVTPAAGASAAIVIDNFAFTVSAAAPGTLNVRNDDSTTHTITADDGSFDVTLGSGKAGTIDVAAAGSFPFHCKIHSSMKSTLVVA